VGTTPAKDNLVVKQGAVRLSLNLHLLRLTFRGDERKITKRTLLTFQEASKGRHAQKKEEEPHFSGCYVVKHACKDEGCLLTNLP
jgi:hypothetical protein